MHRKREEKILRKHLHDAGVNITPLVSRAVSEGLKQIRSERYHEHVARKLARKNLEWIDKAAASMDMNREELLIYYEQTCPDYGWRLRQIVEKWEGDINHG